MNLWPLWIALPVGLAAPRIAYWIAAIGSWCMDLVFPFAVLARRPEIQAGPITHGLPIIVLYLQFPVEGLLVYLVLKRNVRPLGVVWRIMLFHFLGLAELWMLSSRPYYWFYGGSGNPADLYNKSGREYFVFLHRVFQNF